MQILWNARENRVLISQLHKNATGRRHSDPKQIVSGLAFPVPIQVWRESGPASICMETLKAVEPKAVEPHTSDKSQSLATAPA